MLRWYWLDIPGTSRQPSNQIVITVRYNGWKTEPNNRRLSSQRCKPRETWIARRPFLSSIFFFLISLKLWLKTPQSSSSRNVTPEDDSWHSEASLAHTTNVQTFSKTFLSHFSFFSPFCTFPQTVVLRPYLAKQPRRSKDVCPLPIAVPYWRTKLSASRKQVINTNH